MILFIISLFIIIGFSDPLWHSIGMCLFFIYLCVFELTNAFEDFQINVNQSANNLFYLVLFQSHLTFSKLIRLILANSCSLLYNIYSSDKNALVDFNNFSNNSLSNNNNTFFNVTPINIENVNNINPIISLVCNLLSKNLLSHISFNTNNYVCNPFTLDYHLNSINSFNSYLFYSTNNSFININSALISAFCFFNFWILSALFFSSVTTLFVTYGSISINNLAFTLLSLGFFMYLLISGFVFFINKYSFGNYTTAMHSFWSSSFAIFWLLESFLFIVFLYLTILSNQEPYFMYDNIQFYNYFVFSWSFFLIEVTPIVFIIFLTSFLQFNINEFGFTNQVILLILITYSLFFIAWVEFYQFFYIINYYNSISWAYDVDSSTWCLDIDQNSTSIVLSYISICLIAKFWHFLFIFGFWLFSVLNWIQLKDVSLSLLSANLQNFVILYLLAWVCMYPWLKFVFSNFLYNNYYWFFTNFSSSGYRVFLYDIYLYSVSILENIADFVFGDLYLFSKYSFFYWFQNSDVYNFNSFSKHIISEVLEVY